MQIMSSKRDCFKKERKPLVPLKTLDIIFRRRYVPNTQHYFTNRKHAEEDAKYTPIRRAKTFGVPKSEKLLSYIKYSDRKEKHDARSKLNLPLALKDNFKMAAARDVSKRLFIPDPPDDVRAVVEIHPEFYTVIEGRPLRSHDDIKVYINNIRNYAMNRQQIGYRRDLVLKIEQNMEQEEKEFERIMNQYKRHIKSFQMFLTEDYRTACAKVARAEQIYNELVAKNTEFLQYITKITILNNILFKLDAIRNVLKVYRSYLFFVAPLPWRQQFDERLHGKVTSIQFETGQFATDNDLIDSMDIDKIVDAAVIEFRDPLPASLFFKEPEQMISMFRAMETQSREYLIQLSKTQAPKKLLNDRIKQLKEATVTELEYFQYYINNLECAIIREEFNEHHLQTMFYRILNGAFYDSVASPDTLKLKICIEYVYEQIFGKCEEGHQNIEDPMRVLELLYMDYNLNFDALDFSVVKQAQHDLFAQDLKMMRLALMAQRELKAFREMTNAMQKAFLPPAKFVRPKSAKVILSKMKTSPYGELPHGSEADIKPTAKLTPEEIEGLTLFTDWCEGLDPKPFLQDYYSYVKPTFDWVPRSSTMKSYSISSP